VVTDPIASLRSKSQHDDAVLKMTDPRLARALMFGAILIPSTGCDTTPETPGNAVIEFLMAAQGGDDDAADDRLCRRLRENGTAADLESIDLVVGASVFGEGTISRTDSDATVALKVVFPPSPLGAEGEPWVAHMVKEDGTWRVCGFEPETP
jgi:hypothetical protein